MLLRLRERGTSSLVIDSYVYDYIYRGDWPPRSSRGCCWKGSGLCACCLWCPLTPRRLLEMLLVSRTLGRIQSRYILGFHNLHHRSIRLPELGALLFGSSQDSGLGPRHGGSGKPGVLKRSFQGSFRPSGRPEGSFLLLAVCRAGKRSASRF